MKIFYYLVAASLLGVAAPASAQPVKTDPVAGYYANTFTVIGAEGQTRFHINKNKSWTGYFPGGNIYKGMWRIQGRKFCFDMKGEDAHPHCFDGMLGKRAGQKWRFLEHGKMVTGSLVAGRR